jgi:hypothetical protein
MYGGEFVVPTAAEAQTRPMTVVDNVSFPIITMTGEVQACTFQRPFDSFHRLLLFRQS